MKQLSNEDGLKSDRKRKQRIYDLDENTTGAQKDFVAMLQRKLTVLGLFNGKIHYTSFLNVLASTQKHPHQALHCDRDPEMENCCIIFFVFSRIALTFKIVQPCLSSVT